MNGEAEDSPVVFSRFRMTKRKLSLILLAMLAMAAFIEFLVLGLARRTFIFYDIDKGIAVVEERMLRVSNKKPLRSSGREADITRYVEEALLGPISPNSLPLFPKETRLCSLLYRDGVVYLDLSEDAALPPLENSPVLQDGLLQGSSFQGAVLQSGEVFTNMETLYSGIKRNFPYVRDLRFFIAGKAAYADKFR
ncbi:MAG: hypothetical protein LBG95_07735 [Treponema sp.]|jgi:hypothetical protein|nr:hypothetical protein [Treponema sp.]